MLEEGELAQTSKGTPPYAAPEQFDTNVEHGYDSRVDIYSLGLTLYVLANKGRFPFFDGQGSYVESLNMRLTGTKFPRIPDVCDDLNNVMLKACEYDCKKRYQKPSEMRADLKKILQAMENAEEDYETEPALSRTKTEDGYETELALGGSQLKEDCETEFALSGPKAEDCETELALGCKAVKKKEINRDNGAVEIDLLKSGEKEKALEYFESISENNDFSHMFEAVSKYYSNPTVLSSKSDEAIFWYKKCIELSQDTWIVSLAEYQLGEIYSKGLGTKKNHKLAETYYSSSAQKGNMYAKKKFVAGKYIK